MDHAQTNDAARPKWKVRRYSPDRLRREKVTVPAESTVSAETHRGRLMVRVEMPQVETPSVNGLGNLGKPG